MSKELYFYSTGSDFKICPWARKVAMQAFEKRAPDPWKRQGCSSSRLGFGNHRIWSHLGTSGPKGNMFTHNSSSWVAWSSTHYARLLAVLSMGKWLLPTEKHLSVCDRFPRGENWLWAIFMDKEKKEQKNYPEVSFTGFKIKVGFH